MIVAVDYLVVATFVVDLVIVTLLFVVVVVVIVIVKSGIPCFL